MVTDLRKLRQLRELARLRQEIELARFARLNEADRSLTERQSTVRTAGREALGQSPQSALEAQMQERFRDLTEDRLARLQAERAALQPQLEAQRDLAAGAVGRDTVLGRLNEKLALAARRDQSRRE